jgi:hypothetical protein
VKVKGEAKRGGVEESMLCLRGGHGWEKEKLSVEDAQLRG